MDVDQARGAHVALPVSQPNRSIMEYGTCTVIAELAGGAKHTLRCNSARVEKDPETGRVTAFLREQPQTDAAIHINTPAIASIQVLEVDEAWAEEDDELDELDNIGEIYC